MNPNNQIPHRFRQDAFRRFEPCIRNIVLAWPQQRAFAPAEFPDGIKSPETFSCRLRDALRSLRQHQWETQLNMGKFYQIVDEIEVRILDNGSVECGPSIRGLIGAKPGQMTASPQGTNTTLKFKPTVVIELETAIGDIVQAFAVLSHHRILEQPVILIGNADKINTALETLSLSYDISFERSEDGSSFTLY